MSHALDYEACLKTMYGLRRFGIKLGLSTIAKILNGLGNPQDQFACIHVAGTNGKGSVASTLATILYLCGYNVGLYTSPHLVRFNERICVNNCQISDEAVVSAYHAVNRVHKGGREPTFFEFATAMAFYDFGRRKVDWAVIETGMGGRLDATNIVRPALSIITNVSLEHRAYLGNTLSQIAFEKAGIIKNHTPVITGVKQKPAISVVTNIAEKKSAPLYRLGKAFRTRRSGSGSFSYFGMDNIWRNLQTALRGSHQIDNAALALAACEILIRNNVAISLQKIKEGFAKNRWPGRLEVVATHPLIILDGAHNFIAARNLSKYLAKNISTRRLTLVVGILDDKPYAAMLKSLLPVCSRAILTRAQTERALPPETLFEVAQNFVSDITLAPNVEQAVKLALETVGPQEAICIAGSLYVVGEAKEAFEKGILETTKTAENARPISP